MNESCCHCGAPIAEDEEICHFCGQPTHEEIHTWEDRFDVKLLGLPLYNVIGVVSAILGGVCLLLPCFTMKSSAGTIVFTTFEAVTWQCGVICNIILCVMLASIIVCHILKRSKWSIIGLVGMFVYIVLMACAFSGMTFTVGMYEELLDYTIHVSFGFILFVVSFLGCVFAAFLGRNRVKGKKKEWLPFDIRYNDRWRQ